MNPNYPTHEELGLFALSLIWLALVTVVVHYWVRRLRFQALLNQAAAKLQQDYPLLQPCWHVTLLYQYPNGQLFLRMSGLTGPGPAWDVAAAAQAAAINDQPALKSARLVTCALRHPGKPLLCAEIKAPTAP